MIVKPLGTEMGWPIIWPLAEGETIVDDPVPTPTIYPIEVGGVTVRADSAAVNGATTTCLFEGGVFGHIYEATTLITTSAGRKLSKTITMIMGITEAGL